MKKLNEALQGSHQESIWLIDNYLILKFLIYHSKI